MFFQNCIRPCFTFTIALILLFSHQQKSLGNGVNHEEIAQWIDYSEHLLVTIRKSKMPYYELQKQIQRLDSAENAIDFQDKILFTYNEIIKLNLKYYLHDSIDLNYVEEVNKKLEHDNHHMAVANFNYLVGDMFLLLAADTNNCIAYLKRADEEFKKVSIEVAPYQIVKIVYISLANTLGIIYGDKKDYQTSNSYFELGLSRAEILNIDVWQGIIKGNLVFYNISKNQSLLSEKDREHVLFNIANSIASEEYAITSNAYELLYKNEFKQGNYEAAMPYIDSSIHYVEIHTNAHKIRSHARLTRKYFHKANALFLLNKSDEAQAIMNKAMELLSSQNNIVSKEYSELIKMKYGSEQLTEESIQLRERTNRNRFLLKVVIVFLIILSIVLLWVYRLNQNLKRSYKEKNKLAESLYKLNDEKIKLFAVIAHDVRGPMYNLEQMIDFYNDKILDKNQFEEMLDNLKQRLGVVSKTFEDLINWSFTSMSSGISAIPTPFKPQEVVDELLMAIKDNLDKKHLNIIIKNNVPSQIRIDKNHFTLILRNLLSNAIKFSHPNGSIYLDFNVLNKNFQFSIKDEGKGMTKSQIEDLLRKDKKFSSEGTAGEKGAGFGFKIVQELIAINRGNLNIVSEIEKGTVFTVSIPLN